jgi:hypothetical protein
LVAYTPAGAAAVVIFISFTYHPLAPFDLNATTCLFEAVGASVPEKVIFVASVAALDFCHVAPLLTYPPSMIILLARLHTRGSEPAPFATLI